MKTIKTIIVSALLLSGVVRAGEKPSLEPWKLSETERIAQARKDAKKRADREEEIRAQLFYERARSGLSFESGEFRL